MLLELANMVLSYDLRSLLDDRHLLVYLLPVVLLVVVLEWLQRVFLLQAEADVAEADGGLDAQGLLEALCKLEVGVRMGNEPLGQIKQILICVFDGSPLLPFYVEALHRVHS